jgi:hypothetical protein
LKKKGIEKVAYVRRILKACEKTGLKRCESTKKSNDLAKVLRNGPYSFQGI